MAMSNSWAPNETDYEIYQDKIWLQSDMLSNIPYGVELTLFVMCFVSLLQNMNRYNKKRQIFLLTFIVLIFGLGTVFMIANSLLTQQAFVLYRNFPGGPAAFMDAMFSDSVGFTTSVTWVVSNWLLDAFLTIAKVWRFVVVYKDVSKIWLWAMVAIPCSALTTSFVIGVIVLHAMAQSTDTGDSTPFVDATLTLIYYVISTAINILLTVLIAGRLLAHRKRMVKVLGEQHSGIYVSIATIIIESAIIYSSFAIPFLITFGLGSPVSNTFLNFVNSTQAISAFLIIFRVAVGKAWTEDTSTRGSQASQSHVLRLREAESIHFAPNISSSITESIIPASNKSSGATMDTCNNLEADKAYCNV